MALLTRIFSRTFLKKDADSCSTLETTNAPKPLLFSINKNDIRVVLYRECDRRGRKLLFDSTSVEKVQLDSKTPLSRVCSNSSDLIVEISNDFGYKYKKPHADTTNLGEAIFGSIAIATRSSGSIKVHLLKDPARLMFSKIIQAPRSRSRRHRISDEKMVEDSQGSSINSMAECPNSGSFGSKSGSFEATLNDSGFDGGQDFLPGHSLDKMSPIHWSCSSYCPLHRLSLNDTFENDCTNSSSSLQSGSSLSSLRRRWARSVTTSLSLTDTPQSSHTPGSRTKLGITLIVPLTSSSPQEMEQFILERMPLMNNILTRLQDKTERAYCHREIFVHSMVQASNRASQSVLELLSCTQLENPLWLTLTSDNTDAITKAELAQSLISDLAHLLATLDTKHTNFFISTLLTAVLTQHLGWVPSVLTSTPSGSMFAEFSRSHPYNPLWAQISDLQGALGYPSRIAKTVVVGKSTILIQKLLSILSYFIRCGRVTMTEKERYVTEDEEGQLEHLLVHGKDKSSFDKEAIKEFSKAGSVESCNSSSTLTKSRTVLSMKTFSVTDCAFDNAKSLESGFESRNDVLGDRYQDGNKLMKHEHVNKTKNFGRRNKSSSNFTHLVETSFSNSCTKDLNNIRDESPLIHTQHLPVVIVQESNPSIICKIENEKQFTSTQTVDIFKRNPSKLLLCDNDSVRNSFSKDSLCKTNSISEAALKDSKVVFVLGENEELVNIKTQAESNIPEMLIDSPVEEVSHVPNFQPPAILIDQVDTKDSIVSRERVKTEFIGGDVKSRVLIVRSTPIEIEGPTNSTLLKTSQLLRCLSVPEEAVSETTWVKKKRSRDAMKLVRRWLSDSALQRSLCKSECKLDALYNAGLSAMPDCVFRTSNRSLKDASEKLDGSLELLVNYSGCVVPNVTVEEFGEEPPLPVENNKFTDLPSPSSLDEIVSERYVKVANSLLGGVSEVFCPDLVLQGVTRSPEDWVEELHNSLSLEADSAESEAVCILANTETCEVLLFSSQSLRHTVKGRRGGMRVGMSQLVANMLETSLHLYNLTHMPQLCLSHLETKLSELCVRSQAMAELLLNSDFLDMATLTSELDLDANDVPLLLSVASTHTPLVTRKYGLSFQ